MTSPTHEKTAAPTLRDVIEALRLERLTPETPDEAARTMAAAYATDLLSDVLAHAPRGGLLVTVQAHLNVIAVAVHAEQVGVIFAMGRRPDETVLARAREQGIAAFLSTESTLNIAGQLYALGLRGDAE